MKRNNFDLCNQTRNPFRFLHGFTTFLAIRVSGSQLPSKGFRPNFKDKIVRRELRALYDNTGVLTENHGCLISADDFIGGNCFFVFDLCEDKTNGLAHGHQEKQGSIDLEITFERPLPESISVLIYSAYDAVVAINKNRNVIVY